MATEMQRPATAAALAEEAEEGLPTEELLRLDDGTVLPAELAELRSLLQLQATLLAPVPDDDLLLDDEEPSEDELRSKAKLHALHTVKAEYVTDCLMAFDECLLFLHDKVLDHERLVKQLADLRKQKMVRPSGRCRFDESVCVSDDEDEDAGRSAIAHAQPDVNDLRALLAEDADEPGAFCDAKESGPSSARRATEGTDLTDDEELLDQKVVESRQQIKNWVRALEEGSRDQALPAILGAKQVSKFSQRLRGNTAAWQQRGVR